MKELFGANFKTTLHAFAILAVMAFVWFKVIDKQTAEWSIALLVTSGFLTAGDGTNIKKILVLIPIFVLFGLQSCTDKNYKFAKYAVEIGFDLAEDAGAFDERKIYIQQPFKGDTIFFYNGVNKYFIQKVDSTYIVTFTPSRRNLQDTTLFYLKKKESYNKDGTGENR